MKSIKNQDSETAIISIINLLLFNDWQLPIQNKDFKYTLSQEFSWALSADATRRGLKEKLDYSYITIKQFDYFKKSVEKFIALSEISDRKSLFNSYNDSSIKTTINYAIAIQRSYYPFELKNFPPDLDSDTLDFALVEMKLLPVQIFTFLDNRFKPFFIYFLDLDITYAISLNQYKNLVFQMSNDFGKFNLGGILSKGFDNQPDYRYNDEGLEYANALSEIIRNHTIISHKVDLNV